MNTKPPRAWWEKKMWNVCQLQWNRQKSDWSWVHLEIDEPYEYRYILSERVKLLWPTGLQDKKGTEIYEKNIFKSDDRVSPFEIVFFDGSFRGHYGPAEPSLDAPGFRFDTYEASRGEVIGNIHQHKHLLETKDGKSRNARVER